jgi:hypothetical protein
MTIEPETVETLVPKSVNFITDVVGAEGEEALEKIIAGWVSKAVRLGFPEEQAWAGVDFLLMSLSWDHLMRASAARVFTSTVFVDPVEPPTSAAMQ